MNINEIIISPSQYREQWLIKNNIELYNNIIKYCITNNLQYLTYKEKLWYYKNNITKIQTCHKCNNSVRFLSVNNGYKKYCSQICSIDEVEEKKLLLNYSRKAKKTKEEKEEELKIKQQNKELLLYRKQQKMNINLSLEEFKTMYENNKNGSLSKEYFLKNKYPEYHEKIIAFNINNNDIEFNEKIYRFINNIKETQCCIMCKTELKFKNKTLGYPKFCSVTCSSVYTNEQANITYFDKTGYKHHSLNPYNIQKRKDRIFEKIQTYINDSELLSIENDIVKIKCISCNKIHENHINVLKQRMQLNIDYRDCITNTYSTSDGENKLYNFIKDNYKGSIITRDRKLLSGQELDIYLPELNLAFEFNGIYWHSELFKDKNYHYNKYKLCEAKGVQLIQIYEDDWKYNNQIIKSRILNLLNKSNRIYARKCIIQEIPFSICKEFLINNHLQGSINSSKNYGLYYNNELVSVMTFGKPRKSIKYKTLNDNVYELYRFCNKLNTTVIGGASKLFEHFIKNNKHIDEIYSFSNNEWSGKLYYNMKMRLKAENKLSYWIINKNIRHSRHNYNKQNLIKMGYDKNKSANQILADLKLYKIYGAGTKTFVWYKN